MKLMTHVVIGYPSLDATVDLVKTMVTAGADMVELQIPFSDPIADGPTIMRACEKSLKNGTKVIDAFVIAKKLSQEPFDSAQGKVSIPLYFMAYYNTVFRYGVEKFCKDAKESGITGLIIPDMPIDEEAYEHFFAFCSRFGLENIRVVSPASTNERLAKNAKVASGFVYATAQQGTTGAKDELPSATKTYLAQVQKHFSLPLAVGFGISKPEHVSLLDGIADIAIVGSAIIDVIHKSTKESMLGKVKDFITSLNVVK